MWNLSNTNRNISLILKMLSSFFASEIANESLHARYNSVISEENPSVALYSKTKKEKKRNRENQKGKKPTTKTRMSKKVLIVGEKWPASAKTMVQIDSSKQLKDVLEDLAKQLSVEKSVLENECVICRAVEGGKMGTPVIPTEPLEAVLVKPILFIRNKPAASPAAKPGAKLMAKPGVKVPPPPPGAKTSSPKVAAVAPTTAAGATSPVKKTMVAPPGTKSPMVKSKIPPPPTGAKKVAVAPTAKPSPKPASSTSMGAGDDFDPTSTPASEPATKNEDDDDFDPTAAAEKFGTGFGSSTNNNSSSKPAAKDDSDDDGNSTRKANNMNDNSDDDNNNNNNDDKKRSIENSDDDVGAGKSKNNDDDDNNGSASVTPPSEEKPAAAATAVAPTKKVFAKKATTTPPPETATPSKPAVITGQSTSSILNTVGNSSGMDNVAATLAAQRSVDERLLQLQKGLIDEEKKRLEQYELNLRHALAAEVDTIKQQLNASMAEERARSMQVQAVLEEQRTQLLRALAERDGQLQMAQGALQEAVTLGGKQAGPALQAITGTGGASSSSGAPYSSSSSQLAREMQAQNDQLKKLLANKDIDNKASKNTNRAELDAMIRAQTELVGAIGHLKTATSPAPSAIEEQKKDLASFLASVGLARFSDILQKQDIDLEILSAMNDEELQRAGVDTVGARKRILLEFVKNKKNFASSASPSANNNNNVNYESRELFGSPAGAKKSVVFGENQITLIPSKDANKQQQAQASPRVPPGSGNQAQQDAQQASIQAANLSPVLQDHHRVLHQLFRRAGAADWLSRSAEMVDSFKDSLPALYEAVCSKLGVPTPNFQSGTGALALKQFISRRFPHLIPAIDVMVFLADGREAEFADTMMLRQLKIGPQRLVWFSVPVPPNKAPDFAEDTSDGKEKLYFYSALSKMSQWKRPTLFQDKPVPKVVLPAKPLDDNIPSAAGEKLSPNPQASRIGAHRATDQQFIAATLSLLMRKDPSKLTQFPDFCRAYERKAADGQGEGKINYKGMYLDALQAYGPDDDAL